MKKLLCFVLLLCCARAALAADVRYFSFTASRPKALFNSYKFERETMTLRWRSHFETRSAEVTPAQYERLCALVDELKLRNWNGFDRIAMDVLDGPQFDMAVGFTDKTSIHARGYAHFPNDYRAVKEALFAFFDDVLKDAPKLPRDSRH
jgi:hypothetical protein